VPRWAVAIGVNNFLDQDTHLLGTAQARYLPWELERANHGQPLDRRALFRYQSPSENLLIAIGERRVSCVSCQHVVSQLSEIKYYLLVGVVSDCCSLTCFHILVLLRRSVN
jgi:hypothetical protein